MVSACGIKTKMAWNTNQEKMILKLIIELFVIAIPFALLGLMRKKYKARIRAVEIERDDAIGMCEKYKKEAVDAQNACQSLSHLLKQEKKKKNKPHGR